MASILRSIAGVRVVRSSPRLLSADFVAVGRVRVWVVVAAAAADFIRLDVRRVSWHSGGVGNHYPIKIAAERVTGEAALQLCSRDGNAGVRILDADPFIHLGSRSLEVVFSVKQPMALYGQQYLCAAVIPRPA